MPSSRSARRRVSKTCNIPRCAEGRLADDIILETRGLTKEFKGFVAVKDVHLKVRRGSIHALIGPNGAGKTTCFNLLTHFLEPTRGRILYKGRDITGSRAGAHRAHGAGALVPDLGGVPAPHRARERARRAAAQARRLVRLLALGAGAEALDDRARELIEAVGCTNFKRLSRSSCPTGASARWRSPPRSRSIPR